MEETTTNNTPPSQTEVEDEEMVLLKAQIKEHPLFPLIIDTYNKARVAGLPPIHSDNITPMNATNVNDNSGIDKDDPELNQFMCEYFFVLNENVISHSKISYQIDKFCQNYLTDQGQFPGQLPPLYNVSIESLKSKVYNQVSKDTSKKKRKRAKKIVPTIEEEKEEEVKVKQHAEEAAVEGGEGNEEVKEENVENKKKKKGRQLFEKEKLEILKNWLFQNTHDPYPTSEQKAKLCEETGFNMTQINNWFTNARRRTLNKSNKKVKKDKKYKTQKVDFTNEDYKQEQDSN